MTNHAQRRAIKTYRARLAERGLARFEVLGRPSDRNLLRAIARRLAERGQQAVRLRAELSRAVEGEAPATGGVLAALRRSPLVGAELDLTRTKESGRPVDL